MSNEGAGTAEAGVIENIGLLDLTGASAERLAEISRIENVGLILVPEGLTVRVERISRNVGATIPIPEGVTIKVISGQATVGGEVFANRDGDENIVLVVSGQVIVTSPIQQVGYRDVIVSGQILAPRGSEGVLGAGITRLAGQTIFYPYTEGMEVRIRSGQIKMSGEALANPTGNENDLLLVVGQLVITGPVERVGYKELIVVGQAAAPRESEAILGQHTGSSVGQIGYYANRNPRFFMGEDHFAAAFFELLPEPVTLVLLGDHRIEQNVPVDLLQKKVSEITLLGRLRAPRRLVPVLQVLAVEKLGQLLAIDEEADE
jgi:hypothetical protein